MAFWFGTVWVILDNRKASTPPVSHCLEPDNEPFFKQKFESETVDNIVI